MRIFSAKYEVIEEIGRGGMGIVYKVRHRGLGTLLALKTLPSYLATKPQLVARFDREARVMAGLHHPNIVRIIDFDRDEEPYLVMDYVGGEDLSVLVARHGPLPLATVLSVASQVLAALAHAHSRTPAIVHRDIKPSNILIEAGTGRAVVTDFGIAKLVGDAGANVTGTGLPLGTPRYCAPEQREGRGDVDGRADIYSVGVLIHEMLRERRGASPDGGDTLDADEWRGPLEMEGIAAEIRPLIRRATAPAPADRFPTAESMLHELDGLRERLGVETTARVSTHRAAPGAAGAARGPRAWRRRAAAVASVLLILLALGALATNVPSRWLPWARLSEPDTIAVLAFANQRGDGENAWYSRALQVTFNTELSKIPQLSVVAPEVIESLSAQKGMDPMRAARELGVARFVTGSFAVVEGDIRIDARIVDAETGYQTAAAVIEGKRDRFFELQKSLALATLRSLAVELTEAQQASLRATTNTRLDRYRMLLEAEGMMDDAVTAPPPDAAAPPRDVAAPPPDGAGRPEPPGPPEPPGRLGFLLVGVAHAAGSQVEDAEIRRVLEQYRRAMEKGDVDRLERLHTSLSSGLREAVRKYASTARDLRVQLDDIEIDRAHGSVVVSFTRRDRFIDPDSGEPQTLELRVTKFLVPVAGSWTFAAPREVGAWELLRAAEERNRLGAWKDRRATLRAEVLRGEQIVRSSASSIVESTGAGGPHRTRIEFTSPADLADFVFVRTSWPDGRAEEWMWSPATRRARRLPVGEGVYFESSYGPELGTRELEQVTRLLQWTPADAEARIVGEERLGNAAATIVEVVPREAREGSTRYRLWITEGDLLLRRVEMIGASGAVEKRVHLREYEPSGRYQVATEIELERLTAGERALLHLSDLRYDDGVSERTFGLEQLMRGR